MPGDDFGCHLGFIGRLVREHGVAADIADRINMRHIRALLLVDRNKAALVDDDARFVSRDVLAIRTATHGQQHHVVHLRFGGCALAFEAGEQAPAEPQMYDMVLLAVGRRPNGKDIAADKAGVIVNERGFIPVDKQQRTNVPHIFAIGDICGDPMLAHKATNEAKVAAEVIAGHKVAFDAMTIPSVAYTDPEIAWMGVTETEAKAKGIPFEKASFPWAASGRALAMGRDDGVTKLLWDPTTKRIIGAGIVGVNAGELLAETVLAMEMGADLEDLALTVHAHPTLSETPMFAAEMGLGSITDLYIPPKK